MQIYLVNLKGFVPNLSRKILPGAWVGFINISLKPTACLPPENQRFFRWFMHLFGSKFGFFLRAFWLGMSMTPPGFGLSPSRPCLCRFVRTSPPRRTHAEVGESGGSGENEWSSGKAWICIRWSFCGLYHGKSPLKNPPFGRISCFFSPAFFLPNPSLGCERIPKKAKKFGFYTLNKKVNATFQKKTKRRTQRGLPEIEIYKRNLAKGWCPIYVG